MIFRIKRILQSKQIYLFEVSMRADKYLWAVRIYKTRSLAAEACKKGRVLLGEQEVKPSKIVKEDDVLKVKLPPIWRTFRIKALLKNRVGNKLVPDYIEDITPQKELRQLEEVKLSSIKRERGAGRPTKKDRREMDKLKNFM